MTTIRKYARAWFAWFIVAAILGGYYSLWTIATEPGKVSVTLIPQKVVHMTVFSLWGHWMDFEMRFNGGFSDRREADLGKFAYRKSPTGELTFPSPGQPILTVVSVNGGPSVELEAMPAGARSSTETSRRLTLNHYVADGEWNWSPRKRDGLWASPGKNEVSLTIIDVGHPLMGEEVTLVAQPPLSSKSGQSHYGWLWFAWLLCPLGAITLGIAGLALIWKTVIVKRV
ncbi:hypothetical protein [Paraburkholderia rhynchosiae]|uniref:Uncharacterized protein n=1 Tax=Paraburkholderia rhynchosiae TaxID=487049 RepID=A0A2N7VTQ3_9BURK|nr:hypothetical protein [Paraburkholderia rhynchosiae]PMS20523.1 hypothetical protein C0Z16_34605 [Paraburkholderia rhynchosiae]CAB3743368.1 hypothetical protein LMG27174_06972 [Paraburkholderia rhynchosiae]